MFIYFDNSAIEFLCFFIINYYYVYLFIIYFYYILYYNLCFHECAICVINSTYIRRYIIFEITVGDKSNKPLQLKTTILHNVIQQKVQQLYGDFGVAAIKAGFSGNIKSLYLN